MSDNLQPASNDEFALPGWRVIALSGRDALAFAQAQFMNDIATLADGQWQWNGWLTPKGRVIALFALLRFDAETLWLVLPDAGPMELAAQLQRYVFRSKVTLTVHEGAHARGRFATPSQAEGNRIHGTFDAGIELDLSAEGGPRTLRIGTAAAPSNPASEAAWRAQDLLHGLPRLDAAQAEHWTPQQLSLERLRAFSVKKGCYPGQEIIARTHYLGKAKRGLAVYEAATDIAVGAEISSDGRVIGSMVCVQGHLGLAVVTLDAASAPLSANATALLPRTLLGGLAR